jgi:Protein of unknown function (DUF1800)
MVQPLTPAADMRRMADDLLAAVASATRKKRKRKKKKRCRVVKRTKVVQGKRKTVKVRKCRPRKKKKPVRRIPAPAPAPAPPVPDPPAPPRLRTIQSPIAVYQGPFGLRQAERLAWRAGFGPRPGQAAELAAMDLEGAVLSFTRPEGQAPMDGPEPRNGSNPINPASDEGAFAYWLDRMVRSRHQLVERLALIFHDWWATRRDSVDTNASMLNQTNIFRAHGLGSFRDMTRAVTTDPAMLQFLDGMSNRRGAVNENYARELMELFTLGADRGAYTEYDVRELARSLTGWRADYVDGWVNWRWDQNRWDSQNKTVFGRTGRFNWMDACELVLTHPMHPSFFVRKLWSYFVPTPPSDATAAALEQHYVATGLQVRPIVEAILCSPDFHEGPRMVKPPVVLAAGLMRASGRGIENNEWYYRSDRSGQRIYYPPDVSGWNDQRWLDTNTTVGRWDLVSLALAGRMVTGADADRYPAQSAAEALAAARAYWGDPDVTPESVDRLLAFAQSAVPATGSAVTLARLRAQRFNALRQLIAAGPDHQTC